jgi:hypothetical protein
MWDLIPGLKRVDQYRPSTVLCTTSLEEHDRAVRVLCASPHFTICNRRYEARALTFFGAVLLRGGEAI